MKYIIVIINFLSLSYALGFNYKFAEVINKPNVYVSNYHQYFIKVDKSSIEVLKYDKQIIYQKLENVSSIIKSKKDNFTIKQYYDIDKQFELSLYNKIELKDEFSNLIAMLEFTNNSIVIITNDDKQTFSFADDNQLQSNISLNILWSSYYGGWDNDSFTKISKNDNDELLLAGGSSSSSINSKYPILPHNGNSDFMVLKTDKEGYPIWLTFIGGGGNDYLYSMVVDSENNSWICGETRSSNFYVKNAIYPNSGGGTADGAVSKIDDNGNVIFSTYIGGSAYDALVDIAFNNFTNQVWLSGRTTSSSFPTTADAEKSSRSSSYDTPIVGINYDGKLVYSSLFGSNGGGDLTLGDCIEVDKNGDLVIVGYSNAKQLEFGSNSKVGLYNNGSYDTFIAKFNSNGKLKWSRFFGGNSVDYGNCLAIDSSNNIIINSTTRSTNLQCINSSLKNAKGGGMDNHFAKFDNSGNLIWSGYIGGNNDDGADYDAYQLIRADIDVANNGDYFFTFFTKSNDLFTDDSSAYRNYRSELDIYLMSLDENSFTNYTTYLGSNNQEKPGDILLWDDKVYLAGWTSGSDFPIINRNSYLNGQNDGVIVCFSKIVTITDKTPPNITSQSADDCGNMIEYYINDENNPYGYKNINILQNDNCSVVTVIKDRILKVTISKNSLDKNAYYKIEITNQADKKLIIEDSILANSANLIRTEPANFLDLGKLSVFNNQYCQDIKIFNDSDKEFIITDAYFKNYKYFSFSLSHIPVKLPPKSNKDFTLCVSPLDMKQSLINDTLVLVADCFYKELPLKAEYTIPNLNSGSKCDVSLEVIPDSISFFNYQSIVHHNNELIIESNSKLTQNIELFDLYSAKINEVEISIYKNMIKIDFNNLANGTYFIYIKEEKAINIIQLYLIR